MLPEEGEMENGMVRLGFRKIPPVLWSLSSYMNLDRKHFILPLSGSSRWSGRSVPSLTCMCHAGLQRCWWVVQPRNRKCFPFGLFVIGCG